MITFNEVQAQLMGINSHFRFLGISEIKQLAVILQPGENIMDCLNGWCNGGVSMLCATDKRMLIVGKSTAHRRSHIQEISYETVSNMQHNDHVWSSILCVEAGGSRHEFRSWRIKRLGSLHKFVGRHISYLKEQSEATQQLLRKSYFQSNVRPATTSRNWSVFAKRIGNASVR